MHQAVALWSINERLAGRAGVDLPRPDESWVEDLLDVMMKRAEDQERDRTRNEW